MKKNILSLILSLFITSNVSSAVFVDLLFQNPDKTEVSNTVVTDITETRAKCSFAVRGEEITEIGICYDFSHNPTSARAKKIINYQGSAMDVPIDVSYKVRINGLDAGKEYFVRAYVKNKSGKIFYSNEVSFKTEKDEIDYNAMLNGPKKDYYPNGVVMKDYTLKDGQVEGNMKFYNEEGVLVADEYIKNGIQNGTCKYYHPNGQLKTQIELTDGVQNGQLIEYDADGTLTTESNLTGTPPEFSGVVKHYFKDGQIRDITNFSRGKLSSSIHYDIEGRVTSEVTENERTDYSYDNDGWKHTSHNGEKCTCAKCSENSGE